MNILTISNYFPNHPGGVEIVAQNLVLQWRKNHIVRWAACDIPPRQRRHEEDDVPLRACNFSEDILGFPYPIPSLASISKIAREVRWCDIVHIHDCLYLANIIAYLISKILFKPIVLTQHIGPVPYREFYKNALQIIAYETIGRIVLGRSNEIIFINQMVENWFASKMKLPKTSLLQNGTDHKIFFPPADKSERRSARNRMGFSENDILFLFVGRFTQKKGVNLIYEMAKARPNYKWLMLGGGEISVSNWNLQNVRAFPHQPQKQLREFYIAADVFVLPSQGEGFPLAVQEALSCGLPAAVSDETAASLPDAPLISLDISSVPKLIKTIDGIVEKPGFLNLISRQSSEYAKRWDWEIVSNQYIEHFTETIHEFRAS